MASSAIIVPTTPSPGFDYLVGQFGTLRTLPAFGGYTTADARALAGDSHSSFSHTTCGGWATLNLPVVGIGQAATWEQVWGPPAWIGGQTYYAGVIVSYNGANYRFLPAGPQQCLTTTPDVNVAQWAPLTAVGSPSGPRLGGRMFQYILDGSAPTTLRLNVDTGPDPSVIIQGKTLDGVTKADHSLRSNGYVDCEGLRITNSVHGGDPSIGTGTLVAGTATITTQASDASSRIFINRTNAAGASPKAGVLSVINKLANSFQVVSLDPATGALLNTDVGTFDWVILNPVW